jgi:hypothetical protein
MIQKYSNKTEIKKDRLLGKMKQKQKDKNKGKEKKFSLCLTI